MSKPKIVSYSSTQLKTMRARGESRTDWARVRRMTDAEITANAKSDRDSPPLTKKDFARAQLVRRGRPAKIATERKQPVTIRLSPDVLAYYKGTGRGWQGRIDAELRKRAKVAAHLNR